MEDRNLYAEMAARGNRLRYGFNQWAGENGYPAQMTGQVSLFQSHLKSDPITKPRDLLGQPMGAIGELQLQFRVNGLFVPFFHLGFISAAHSDEIVDEILQIHKDSVEAVLESYGLI
jgi:glutamate-1-semialdehyde aminotransferase